MSCLIKPQKENLLIDNEKFRFNVFERLSEREYVSAHPHWHEVYEVLFINKGHARQQIDERIFNVSQGDIVFINSNCIHSTYTSKKEENSITVMHFSPLLVQNIRISTPLSSGLSNYSIDVSDKIGSDTIIGQESASLINRIYKEFTEKNVYFETVITGLLLEFTGLLAREFGISLKNETPSHIQKVRDLLSKAFEYIDLNFKEDIKLDSVAIVSNMSISNFCRTFKKATGMTFVNYLTLYRINYSEGLLLTTEKPITDIAYESGFNNITSFIRAFRKLKNSTPSTFRKNYRNG